MGVYIKDMVMPKSCAMCGVRPEAKCPVNYRWLQENEQYYDTRKPDCPLIEVPPHGRLIDADALHYARVAVWHGDKTMPMGGYVGGMNVVAMFAEIKAAPTIIPADKEAT